MALELVRSQQRERRLQVQADRDRIARDLHDHVVQRIFATALALDRIGRSVAAESPDLAARLAERVDELDGLTVELADGAWFNLRASNTEPLLRLNVEAPDEARMTEVRDRVLGMVRA